MNKEFFAKYRWLMLTILVIIVAIGLMLPFSKVIKDFHNKCSLEDPTHIVGIVDENNDIILTDLPNKTYTCYFEDGDGIIEDYHGITVTDLRYTGLIKENIAPVGATRIGVYNKWGWRKGSVDLGSLAAPDLGAKLYSQASISDIHLQQETAVDDFKKAMDYFNNLDDLLFVNICGDLTDVGSAEELAYYKEMRDTYSFKPVYAVPGNHEAVGDISNWTTYTGHNTWYTYIQGDDVYIMVGMTGYSQPFSSKELQWLYETLEANRNKRCFVYQHIFPYGGSGDVAGLNGHGDMLDNIPGQVFLSLMSHYKNVVWFHGHSHQMFVTQEQYQINNIDSIYGRYSVHIPSLAIPRVVSGNEQQGVFEASEGYVVDVYENGIILRGRDFVYDKFVPIATFYLDTTLQTIPQETYYDPTGTIWNKNSPKPDSPDGTAFLINQRYSESVGGIVDANGFASFIIPCVGDGVTPYILQLKNTHLDITKNKSTLFLFDSNQNYLDTVNGSKFFSEMSGVTTLEEGAIQVEFMPTDKTAYIVVCIEEKSNIPISLLDIDDYVISLTPTE